MARGRAGREARARLRRQAAALAGVGVALAISLAAVAARPAWAPVVALLDGLTVGTVLGAVGLVRSYDESWDEFREATVLAYVLGVLALAVYALRREPPSAFFVVECAAGSIAEAMLLFVPLSTWIGVDLLLYAGTFAGWLASGIFRPGYD
jgi:hypothetical protein